MKYRVLSLFALTIPFAGAILGDTLVFRNGSQLSGRLVSAANGSIVFSEEGGRNRRFPATDIGRIEFGAPFGETARTNSDSFGGDDHSRYDQYRNRPDYRESQPQGGALTAKYQDMVNAGVGVGKPISAEQVTSDGRGRFRVYQNSTLYWGPQSGAHEVHGAIREEYLRLGAENSRLGYPISDELAAPDGFGRIGNFEYGSIYWSARTGARVESGGSGPNWNPPNASTSFCNPGYLVLPAGSEIAVRTNESIDSRAGSGDRTYHAQVERDVTDGGGHLIIPRGADAQLVVRPIGGNRIALDLQSVTVAGRRFDVNSEEIAAGGRQGVGLNGRTGEFVGGGAVLGTLLGAIAGGGKGAAIGALAGSAAGIGAQVLTRGDRVSVPAETVLSFRLDQAVSLSGGGRN